MADSKISELTALTTPASDDVLAIVDTSAGVTKKITISNLGTSSEVVDDTTPQLGGDLDLNSNDITGTGNINITGTIQSSGNITGTLATAAQPNITSLGTIASLVATTADINGGTVDGTVIGGTTAGAGTFTTLTANTSITGTLATAAQTNITSVGTLSALTVTGEITANGGIALGDNDKAMFGTGNDLQIYHDGSHSYVQDTGTGHLRLAGDNVQIVNAAINENYIICTANGAVDIYHNGTKKLETTSIGIAVTGEITASGPTTITVTDNSDNLTLTSTDADANIGPNLNLYRNSGSPADNDVTGVIAFNGRNDNSQDVIYARQLSYIKDASDGTEDGQLTLQTMVAGTIRDRLNITPTEISLNEDSQDLDFRVESNGNANAFFVDGGNDRIGIGTGSPTTAAHITKSSLAGFVSRTSATLTLESSADTEIYLASSPTNSGQIRFGDTGGNLRGALQYDHALDAFLNYTAGSERMRIDSSGNVGIGTTSPDSLLTMSASVPIIKLIDSDDNSFSRVYHSAGSLYFDADKGNGVGSSKIQFGVDDTERMRIDSSGNVGIGTSSPTTTSNYGNLSLNGTLGGQLSFHTGGTGKQFIYSSSTDLNIYNSVAGNLIFHTDNSERFRIAADGSLSTPTAGTSNVRFGVNAGNSIISGGNYNTVVGDEAGTAITTGDNNTAVGKSAGGAITTGTENTLLGSLAGDALTTGASNTIIGYNIAANAVAGVRQVAIGSNFTAGGDGTVRIGTQFGQATLTLDGADTSWSATSDSRLKKDVADSTVGLNFIKSLRPVTFKWNAKNAVDNSLPQYNAESSDPVYGEGKAHHGFIAQEVKAVIDAHSDVANGHNIWVEDPDGTQQVAPSALIPMLVKAVQELSATITTLQQEINTLKGE